MKKCLYLFLTLLFWTCAKENGLTVNANSYSNSLFPSFNDSIQYSGSNGDTISFFVLSSSNYFQKTSINIDQGGSIPDLDFIEEERRLLEIGNESKNLRFTFSIRAQYLETNPQFSDDLFQLQSTDSVGNLSNLITGNCLDSLICSNPLEKCFSMDSLTNTSETYPDVYFNLPTNSSNIRAFISPNNGLVKFHSGDSVVFELIP